MCVWDGRWDYDQSPWLMGIILTVFASSLLIRHAVLYNTNGTRKIRITGKGTGSPVLRVSWVRGFHGDFHSFFCGYEMGMGIPTYIVSRAVSEIWWIIGQIFAVDKGCLSLTNSFRVNP